MTERLLGSRSWMVLAGIALAGTVSCTPAVKEEVNQAEVVTYKLVESGTLEVALRGQVTATENYTIEAGSDGHWVVNATQTPKQEGQNVRNIRMELNASFKPIMYSENDEGPNPMGVFISFLQDKTIFNIKQGDNPQVSKTVEGPFDLYADVGLYHHHGLLARAYLAKNTTDKVEFTMLGGQKMIAKQAQPMTVDTPDGPVKVLHIRMILPTDRGQLREHLFVKADDRQLLKIEAGRGALQVYRTDIPWAKDLSSRKAKKAPQQEPENAEATGGRSETRAQPEGQPTDTGTEPTESAQPAGDQ